MAKLIEKMLTDKSARDAEKVENLAVSMVDVGGIWSVA